MSHNFKSGDLALTLISIPGHIDSGTCVEVRRVLAPGDQYEMADGPREAIKPSVVVTWMARNFLYHPTELMPLRGDFTHEQQKAKEAV